MNKTGQQVPERGKTAVEFYKEGYNCAQAVLLVYVDELNFDKECILKISSGFGGGMGKSRETCGAVTGAVMVLGLKYGGTDPGETDEKKKIYELVKKFIENYKVLGGCDSVLCKDLIGKNGGCVKRITDAIGLIEGVGD